MSDSVNWMTYAEIAKAFGIGGDSARNLVRRKRWARQTGNDGFTRVGVPEDQIVARSDDGPTNPPSDPPSSLPTDGASSDGSALVALEVLRAHIGRLETEIAALKDEAAFERVRGAQVDALRAVLEIERNHANDLRQERDRWSAAAEAFQSQLVEQAKRPRGLLGWLRRA